MLTRSAGREKKGTDSAITPTGRLSRRAGRAASARLNESSGPPAASS
jgi:hypothetical protein